MSAVVAALIGAIGIWVVVGLILLIVWIAAEHTWILWVLFFTAVGAIVGLMIYDEITI